MKAPWIAGGAALLAAVVVLKLALSVEGATVTLAWDASPDPSVVNYNIYYGPASASYTNRVAVGNVTTTVINGLRENATYFFAATAQNGSGLESDFSNEVSYQVPTNRVNNNGPPGGVWLGR